MKYVAEVQKPLRSKFPDVRVGGLTQRILYAQQGPRLGNQFLEDTGLMRFMEYFIPQTKYATVKTDLTQVCILQIQIQTEKPVVWRQG